jgi:hypothetical protein
MEGLKKKGCDDGDGSRGWMDGLQRWGTIRRPRRKAQGAKRLDGQAGHLLRAVNGFGWLRGARRSWWDPELPCRVELLQGSFGEYVRLWFLISLSLLPTSGVWSSLPPALHT